MLKLYTTIINTIQSSEILEAHSAEDGSREEQGPRSGDVSCVYMTCMHIISLSISLSLYIYIYELILYMC